MPRQLLMDILKLSICFFLSFRACCPSGLVDTLSGKWPKSKGPPLAYRYFIPCQHWYYWRSSPWAFDMDICWSKTTGCTKQHWELLTRDRCNPLMCWWFCCPTKPQHFMLIWVTRPSKSCDDIKSCKLQTPGICDWPQGYKDGAIMILEP